MRYVLKLVGREGRDDYDFDLDEADLSLAVGTRPIFEMQIRDAHGFKKVTVTTTIEKLIAP